MLRKEPLYFPRSSFVIIKIKIIYITRVQISTIDCDPDETLDKTLRGKIKKE